jgi:hypothetical protein
MFRPGRDQDDLVTGLHFPFFQHAAIETGPAMLHQQRRHFRIIHADAHPVTSDARLRYLEQGFTDPITISDTDIGVGHAIDREVLAELTIVEIVASQLLLPVSIGLDLIDEHCAMLATMSREIGLTVAVEVKLAYQPRARHGSLPDGRPHRLASPRDVTRQTDIH